MITIISISIALLVVVAGLHLLAKTKKEELGGLFTFSSYSVITFGILMVAYAFVGCIISCHSGGKGCGKSGYSQYHGSGYGGGACASYGSKGSGCASYAHCGGQKSCSKGKSCKSSCPKSGRSCKKGDKAGKKKEVRKIIKKEGEDGEEDVNVTIEKTE
jgi:hypothetical protein